MAQQTLQIADKPTLDEVKALLENNNGTDGEFGFQKELPINVSLHAFIFKGKLHVITSDTLWSTTYSTNSSEKTVTRYYDYTIDLETKEILDCIYIGNANTANISYGKVFVFDGYVVVAWYTLSNTSNGYQYTLNSYIYTEENGWNYYSNGIFYDVARYTGSGIVQANGELLLMFYAVNTTQSRYLYRMSISSDGTLTTRTVSFSTALADTSYAVPRILCVDDRDLKFIYFNNVNKPYLITGVYDEENDTYTFDNTTEVALTTTGGYTRSYNSIYGKYYGLFTYKGNIFNIYKNDIYKVGLTGNEVLFEMPVMHLKKNVPQDTSKVFDGDKLHIFGDTSDASNFDHYVIDLTKLPIS